VLDFCNPKLCTLLKIVSFSTHASVAVPERTVAKNGYLASEYDKIGLSEYIGRMSAKSYFILAKGACKNFFNLGSF
jgi:hypothetical protein